MTVGSRLQRSETRSQLHNPRLQATPPPNPLSSSLLQRRKIPHPVPGLMPQPSNASKTSQNAVALKPRFLSHSIFPFSDSPGGSRLVASFQKYSPASTTGKVNAYHVCILSPGLGLSSYSGTIYSQLKDGLSLAYSKTAHIFQCRSCLLLVLILCFRIPLGNLTHEHIPLETYK
jgi:hypothetical protein